MPAMVGGFGKIKVYINFMCYLLTCAYSAYRIAAQQVSIAARPILSLFLSNTILFCRLSAHSINLYTISLLRTAYFYLNKKRLSDSTVSRDSLIKKSIGFAPQTEELGSYLAGLIEGDGTIAVHDKNSTAKKYAPMIIVVFKKADLPLANFLCELTNCGKVYLKSDRGYVLWQIQDLKGVHTILSIINGYMRTPKYEAFKRAVDWFNLYLEVNKNSKLPSTQNIVNSINLLHLKDLDNSNVDSNSWLAGFTDADGNFSINVAKRKNKNIYRVQPFYRLEIRQTYHRISNDIVNFDSSFFPIMSKLATFFNVTLYSRNREISNKIFSSYILMCTTKISCNKVIHYFETYPLLSSKYLDYVDWVTVINFKKDNNLNSAYLDKTLAIRQNFNSTRTKFNWDHLNNCYLIKK